MDKITQFKVYSRNPLAKYLFSNQGVRSIASHHEGDVAEAIVDAFPNIGLDQSKLFANGRHIRVNNFLIQRQGVPRNRRAEILLYNLQKSQVSTR